MIGSVLATMLLTILAGTVSFAQVDTGVVHEAKKPAEKSEEKSSKAIGNEAKAETKPESRSRDGLVSIHYAPFDFILPSKIGGTLGWRSAEKKSWEFEYTRGSVAIPFLIKDLGKLEEDRFTLARRWGGIEGFGFSLGVFYHRFKIHIGDELLNRLSNGTYPSVDLLAIEGIGAMLGLGYRWVFKQSIVLGLDLFSWSQPLITTKRQAAFLDVVSNQNDRDNIDSALKVMQYFPRFSALKLSLGYAF